jgi:uncharacterized protein YheU (UPF0270 family)
MIIPHSQLSPEALLGLIEEFVTRDGTDYGELETPIEARAAEVMRQLARGTAAIVFNQEDGSCTILPREQITAREER